MGRPSVTKAVVQDQRGAVPARGRQEHLEDGVVDRSVGGAIPKKMPFQVTIRPDHPDRRGFASRRFASGRRRGELPGYTKAPWRDLFGSSLLHRSSPLAA
jgi:hypothetical protein